MQSPCIFYLDHRYMTPNLCQLALLHRILYEKQNQCNWCCVSQQGESIFSWWLWWASVWFSLRETNMKALVSEKLGLIFLDLSVPVCFLRQIQWELQDVHLLYMAFWWHPSKVNASERRALAQASIINVVMMNN